MTKVKICGLFREEDIEYANEMLPDYVGFVFAKSRRQVSLSKAEKLIKKLDKNIKVVGIFVNEEVTKVKNIAENVGLDILQFHGDENKEYIEKIKEFTNWKSMSIKIESEYRDNLVIDMYQNQINEKDKYNIEAIVLDSSFKNVDGGTGLKFDWEIPARLNINKRLILAGGLTPFNVEQAISIVQPYAVDVSSGVETNGIKDFNKIKMFVEKVRTIK